MKLARIIRTVKKYPPGTVFVPSNIKKKIKALESPNHNSELFGVWTVVVLSDANGDKYCVWYLKLSNCSYRHTVISALASDKLARRVFGFARRLKVDDWKSCRVGYSKAAVFTQKEYAEIDREATEAAANAYPDFLTFAAPEKQK
ncbi:MAG: hypothetical protein IJO06_08155 [Thermoguttaceae bacterium]|nr:hypothetical protein [Thermoguttaceae bacterium]